jgi:hypothetical protein
MTNRYYPLLLSALFALAMLGGLVGMRHDA